MPSACLDGAHIASPCAGVGWGKGDVGAIGEEILSIVSHSMIAAGCWQKSHLPDGPV